MQGAHGPSFDILVMAHVDALDLRVVLGIVHEHRGCLYVGNECGGCVRVIGGME